MEKRNLKEERKKEETLKEALGKYSASMSTSLNLQTQLLRLVKG